MVTTNQEKLLQLLTCRLCLSHSKRHIGLNCCVLEQQRLAMWPSPTPQMRYGAAEAEG